MRRWVGRVRSPAIFRAGQKLLQDWKTGQQVAYPVMMTGLLLWGMAAMGWGAWRTTAEDRFGFEQYIWAHVGLFFNGSDATQVIDFPDGSSVRMASRALLRMPEIERVAVHMDGVLWSGVLWSGVFACSGMGVMMVWLCRRGRRQLADTYQAGDYLATPEETKKQIERAGQASDLHWGRRAVPLIKNTELQHILLDGSTGTGKSNAMHALLEQIRRRGDRVVLWDEGGHFLSRFYEPEHDYVLNDLDARGAAWSLWEECQESAEFDSVASALIPMTGVQDPFWVLGARTIFSEVAYAMRTDPQRTMGRLLQTLLSTSLDDLQGYLADTAASILVSDKIEKTAISIKSILAAYLKCLRYVKEVGMAPSFSIRDWVRNDREAGWLFLSSVQNHHETLKPLISARLDWAITQILSLSAQSERRIWVFLDELASLQRLPTLFALLAKGRKPGACVVVGIQNRAQLAQTYGHDGAQILSSLLNTRCLFRQPDPDMAVWSARNAGEVIVEELREGQTYGVDTGGVSLQRQETRKPLVSVSEIMALPDLCCYLRLPGGYPLTRLEFDYRAYPIRHPAFVPRGGDVDSVAICPTPSPPPPPPTPPFPLPLPLPSVSRVCAVRPSVRDHLAEIFDV